ncbi:MAG: hypothetical protein COA41_01855 [Sphingopyxis sp.]|nr:MAG: hypothetical protein COA41_01855 [Sphingopyxis sp.]
MFLYKFEKLGRAILNPGNWWAISHGVVPTIEHGKCLQDIAPASVIDVGANKGQFSVFATSIWPNARFHAFEPLPGPSAKFEKVLRGKVTLHKCALGDQETELEIHIASRADSSSLLPLGEKQKQLYDMSESGKLRVPVKRLDAVVAGEALQAPALLKIDVQGFEYEVLSGISGITDKVRWIYVEASFVELYEGQHLFDDVAELISSLGYDQIGQFNTSYDDKGEKVQADFLFESRKS